MRLETTAQIVATVSATGVNGWCTAALIRLVLGALKMRRSFIVSRVFFELRPFIPGLVVVEYVSRTLVHYPMGLRLLDLVAGAFCWWVYRDDKDDDDRWNKRRKKLVERVASVGGRLQVVPVEASR